MKFIKKLFRFDKVKLDKIISNLNMDRFYGLIGDNVHYHDLNSKTPLISIKLDKKIKIITNPERAEYIKNIGWFDMNEKEMAYFYNQVEAAMLAKSSKDIEENKRILLESIGLTEYQFYFLIKNCKDNEYN